MSSQLENSSSTLILPYGYQIDLDFIRYCENLANIDASFVTDAEIQRRNRRRQRQSMEVMLGIQLEMQQQMNHQMNEIYNNNKTPPDPPPRTHLHSIESPIVPKYVPIAVRQNDTKWDPAFSEVVSDFERTLERSKKGKKSATQRDRSKSRERKIQNATDNCISSNRHEQKTHQHYNEKITEHHTSVETIDGSSTLSMQVDEKASTALKKRNSDLEEQNKLIPLLQMQIQSLKEERKQLLLQLENMRTSSSSSPNQTPQAHFQVHRVSPVSLVSMKMSPILPQKRSVGTNTGVILHRDVGTIMNAVSATSNASTLTDFTLKSDSDSGGRLYSEKDLKKTVEMVHAKMRRSMVSIGVQVIPAVKENRSIATEMEKIESCNASSNTDEPNLMISSIKSIAIDPTQFEQTSTTITTASLSLRDMSKLPASRNSSTQTATTPTAPRQSTKATESADLIRTVSRSTGTEVIYRKDQSIATGSDLIKFKHTAVNTTPPPIVEKRTTACNTAAISTRNVAVNCEISVTNIETSSNLSVQQGSLNGISKIPRPSPNAQRKNAFVRQDTFTVTTNPHFGSQNLFEDKDNSSHLPVIFDVRKSPEKEEKSIVDECPVERLLKLSVSHQKSPSPVREQLETAVEPVKEATPPVKEEEEEEQDEEEEEEEIEERGNESTKVLLMSPSVEYLDEDDDDEEEYEEDEFNDEQLPSNVPSRPPPTSISTIRLVQEGRIRIKPSKEMIAALKVLNDHLIINPIPIESQIHSACDVVSVEWFRISSTETANSDNVEDYLDYFEEQSWDLLTFMVNLTDKNGNTAMHYAVSHGNFDVVSILLDSKVCNINQTNNAGYTCIMLVSLAKLVINEHRTVVQRLFKLSDVNIRASKNSQTALMLAVSHGNLTMVQMMVEAGADINIQDDDGSTALMCAAEQGHLDIVKFLLAQPDCDSTKQDVDGNTALKISLEAGYNDIGCLLYAHEHLLRSKALGVKRTPSRKSSTSSLT